MLSSPTQVVLQPQSQHGPGGGCGAAPAAKDMTWLRETNCRGNGGNSNARMPSRAMMAFAMATSICDRLPEAVQPSSRHLALTSSLLTDAMIASGLRWWQANCEGSRLQLTYPSTSRSSRVNTARCSPPCVFLDCGATSGILLASTKPDCQSFDFLVNLVVNFSTPAQSKQNGGKFLFPAAPASPGVTSGSLGD